MSGSCRIEIEIPISTKSKIVTVLVVGLNVGWCSAAFTSEHNVIAFRNLIYSKSISKLHWNYSSEGVCSKFHLVNA